MNKINFILSGIIFLQLFSCKDDEISLSPKINHCIPKDSLEISSVSCKDAGFDTNYFCNTVYLGSLHLSDSAKWLLHYYCYQPGPLAKFINSNGDTSHLILISKYYTFNTNDLNYPKKCEQDTTRRIEYCYDSDGANVVIRFEELKIEINIGINPVLDYNDELSGRYGDELSFSRKDVIDTSAYYTMYSLIVNKGNLSYSKYYSQDFIKSITFLSKEFKNVYTSDFWSDPNSIPKPVKIYYNGEFGIVSFIDDLGVQWVKL